MKIRKIATITFLVLSSFAANTVAPSKTELEAMYDKAFREFDANNYDQALKDLDAIDARQPDLAESQNLRGVILMRQKDYPNAEVALQKALAADPKFWNARFNLAEIPFLEKNWGEARKRFQELLTGNASELQGEATQLIQYKTMITYLMEGKNDMVEALKGKFELTPETPALQYSVAAIALNKKDEQAAKDALAAAEKNFSPQLNKLFAESLYEVGWLEKPAGQTRAALELNSAAERAAKTKEFAKAKYDEAEQALQQRDMTAARKLIDEADNADPNQAPIVNLRGEILLEQKNWDAAEAEFKKAAKLDPKFRDAQYNLAQIPFKKKDYAKARERFEELFSTTSGVDKDRAAQLIKFKVYLTYLLEGKDARAQKMMEQFQFTGDTPALYYAQAAWEFKHDNTAKANEWVTSARKIYSPALNGVFSDSFFDLGWLQVPAAETSTAVAETNPTEVARTIEPTPIPAITLAKNDSAKITDPLKLAAEPSAPISGMEATTTSASSEPASSALSAAASPSVETPVASTASPAAARPVVANASEADNSAPNESKTAAAAASSPATVLAPAKVREWAGPSLIETFFERAKPILIFAFFFAGIGLLAWVAIPALRQRLVRSGTLNAFTPVTEPSFSDSDDVESTEHFITPTRLAGGPPQVSLQLRASEPALRRAVVPVGKNGRTGGNGAGATVVPTPAIAPAFTPMPESYSRPDAFVPMEEDSFEEGVGEPSFDQPNEGLEFVSEVTELPPVSESVATEPELSVPEPTFAEAPLEAVAPVWENASVVDEPAIEEEMAPIAAQEEPAFIQSAPEPVMAAAVEPVASLEEISEPIGQGQPIPYLTATPSIEEPAARVIEEETKPSRPEFVPAATAGAALLAGVGALRHSVASSSSAPEVSHEPTSQQSTIPATMPQPTPTTPAPTIRTGSTAPMTGAAPQPMMQSAGGAQPAAGGMHTAVQLTFSFEIASLQLTPNFKMGMMQLKPTSKIVTMRLAPSQHPQPAMNLQVTFEIATVQLSGNSIGMIRLTPSQQQRPNIASSPSFNISGLQLVTGAESAPVQLTPSSQQGQTSVHVTAGFQIATVEFSPSFEIASIILNATSRTAQVQLPGTGPSAVEGAPVFEIASVQLSGNGELGMMQIAPAGAKRA